MAGAVCAMTLMVGVANAQEKHQLTDEQKAQRKELLAKYDTNKDGKLDKDEKAKMTAEDKQKWAALSGKKAEGKKEEKSETK